MVSLFFLIGAVALAEDITIDADVVEYDKEGGIVEASGDVLVLYKDVRIEAEHVVFITDAKRVFADKGFTLIVEDQFVRGARLDYRIDERTGSAEDVYMVFKGIYLKGQSIELAPEIVTLDGASFTSCEDEDHPHYNLTASNITLYPKENMLFAYWGWFHLVRFPLVPVPTYVYDLRPEAERKNAAPLPEIGSNDEDGWYAIERFAWHSDSKTHGTVGITYATKKGPGGLFDVNHSPDDVTNYYGRVGLSEKDGWWGGITYLRDFGGNGGRPYLRAPENLLDFQLRREMQFEINLSSRERINYERISFLPDVAVKQKRQPLYGDLKYAWEIRGGKVYEESTSLEATRGGLAGTLSYSFPEIPVGIFSLSTNFAGQFYSEGSRWGQIFGNLDLVKAITEYLGVGWGYRHVVENKGSSPFYYENYRFRPSHQMYASSYVDFGAVRLGARAEYYVPSWDAVDIDYTILGRAHCFDVMASYRALRNEFAIGVVLVTEL